MSKMQFNFISSSTSAIDAVRSIMLVLTCSFIIIILIQQRQILADEIDFQDCGRNEMRRLYVSNCRRGEACIIHKNRQTPVVVEAEFVANQDTERAMFETVAYYHGVPIRPSNYDRNACRHMKCPVRRGETVKFRYEMPGISRRAPNMRNVKLVSRLVGERGVLACAQTRVSIRQ